MTTFDGWENSLYADDVLAHHGILGMKHGRNRYQNPDGTWTEEGLERRRKREGFGERRAARKAERAELRAARKETSAQRKVARKEASAQLRAARKETSAQRKAARKEEWAERVEKARESLRKRNVKNLSDKEIRDRIARMKLEQEYREMTKSPLRKAGERMVEAYMKGRDKAERKAEEKEAWNRRMKEMKEQTIQATVKANAEKARANADRERALTDRIDIQKGTRKIENRANLLKAKIGYKKTTIRGGVSGMVNRMLTAHGENSLKKVEAKKAYWEHKYETKGANYSTEHPAKQPRSKRQKKVKSNGNGNGKKKQWGYKYVTEDSGI